MNILKEDFIGRTVTITNKKGTIIDETKHTITIQQGEKTKKYIKKNHTFTITIKDKEYNIQGKDIEGRPEERIKIR